MLSGWAKPAKSMFAMSNQMSAKPGARVLANLLQDCVYGAEGVEKGLRVLQG